jgi:general secretion pathway protein G
MMTRRVRKAFTLVEILIVVVILGILAAIVIPQFTRASDDAQVGNVQTQLQTIRSQVELYRVRNNGGYPDFGGSDNDGWGILAGNDADGNPGNYMKTPPVNPRTGTSTVATGAEGSNLAAVVRGDTGWIWDGTNIHANGFDETAANDGDAATPAWVAP